MTLLVPVPAEGLPLEQRGVATVAKDPAAVRDYGWDYTDWLAEAGADTIESATVVVSGVDAVDIDSAGEAQPVGSGGITPLIVSDSNRTTVSVWLSGGVAGETASATVTVTTVAGRVDRRMILFLIQAR